MYIIKSMKGIVMTKDKAYFSMHTDFDAHFYSLFRTYSNLL